MRTIVTMMILVLMAGLLVACSGAPPVGDDSTAPVGDGTPAVEKEASAETPKESGSSASDEFLKLLGGKVNVEYMVAYDITNTFDGEASSGKMAQYMKTEKKIRMDFTTEGVESRTYMVNDGFVMCTNDGAWSCLKFDTPKDDESVDVQEQEMKIEESPDDYNILSDGTMQVAGVTAKCFKIESKLQGEDFFKTRYCVKDYVPLYVKTEAQNTISEMTATKYSTRVSDSDFTPPAEPKTFNMGGPSGGAGDLCAACGYLSGADKEDCLANCGG